MEELIIEQGSIEWHHERAGRVTGTSMQSALGARFDAKKSEWVLTETAASKKTQETLANKLIAERMTEIQISELNTAAVQRGREMEPFAIKAITELNNINYESCGMLICDDLREFGFSPDAVIKDDGVVIGGAETKCPSSEKHISHFRKGELPQEYFWQVMSPFICGDSVEWWDFVSFDDRNYEKPLFSVRVYRKDYNELIQQAKIKLKEFLLYVRVEHEKITF